MHIAVVIPTLTRIESLKQTIKSLAKSEHRDFNVFVVVDGDEDYYHRIGNLTSNQNIILRNRERIGWGKSVNMVCNITDFDAYFSASDDLQFFPDTLAEAVAAMERKFPDLDGVIGINQNLRKFCPAAMNLTGRKFINRFPGRQLYSPIYGHFCVDSELWHYAQHQQKFHFCKRSRVFTEDIMIHVMPWQGKHCRVTDMSGGQRRGSLSYIGLTQRQQGSGNIHLHQEKTRGTRG